MARPLTPAGYFGTDYCSREGAEVLASRLCHYWLTKGIMISAEVVEVGRVQLSRGDRGSEVVYGVRSNI